MHKRMLHGLSQCVVVPTITVLGTFSALSSPALAQDNGADAPPAVGEIVVTARYKQEDAQRVPIAVTALTGDALDKQGAFTLNQAARLMPSLSIQGYGGRNQTLTVRGIGTNAGITNDGLEQGVGIYVDGVYRARTGTVVTDLIDVESIQLLRGPQGTLFGKNTVAGALDIKTREPAFEHQVRAEASYGNYDYFRGYLSVNTPITDDLAARVSYLRTSRRGTIRNVVRSEDWENLDNHSARFDLLYRPAGDFKLRFIADYSIQKAQTGFQVNAGALPTILSNGTEVRGFYRRLADVGYTPVSVDASDRVTDINDSQYDKMPSYGFQVQADVGLGGVNLSSITSYRQWKWIPNYDGDQLGISVLRQATTFTNQRQFSQELRLASSGERKINFTAGLYYFWQEADDESHLIYGKDAVVWHLTPNTPTAVPSTLPTSILDGLENYAHIVPATHSYAAYGQATWNVSPQFRITAGLRYTYEHKTGLYDASLRGSVAPISSYPTDLQPTVASIRASFAPTTRYEVASNSDNLSGTLVAAYDFGPALHSYASYSRGYKSPGINLIRQTPGVDIFLKPEKVDAWEVGLKSRLFNDALELNAALFWTDVDDYQASYVNTTVLPTAFYLTNVGKLRSRGVELDSRFTLAEGLTGSLSATFNDATYRKYPNAAPPYLDSYLPAVDLSGRRASGTSKWALGGAIEYVRSIGNNESYVGGDGSYRSSFFSAVNLDPLTKVDGYVLFGAHAGLRSPDARWDVSVWARNLFNRDYQNTVFNYTSFGIKLAAIGEPRAYGVTLRGRF